MPLTSIVWLMKALCSWEINLQASKDTQHGVGVLGEGRESAVSFHSSSGLLPFIPPNNRLASGITKGPRGQMSPYTWASLWEFGLDCFPEIPDYCGHLSSL